MYRVLLERAAEKDLARLSSEIHDRVIIAIQNKMQLTVEIFLRSHGGYPDKVKRILTQCCTDPEREATCQGTGLVNLVKMLITT